MGRAKELMMEEESQGFANPPEWDVCAFLFPRHALVRNFIKTTGHSGQCHFSGKQTIVVTLKELLSFIYNEFRKYYEDPAQGCSYSSSKDDEDFEGSGWHSDNGYILPDSRRVRDTHEVFEKESFYSTSDELDEIISSSIFGDEWVERDPYGDTLSEEMLFQWERFREDTIESFKSGKDYNSTYSKFSEGLSEISWVVDHNKKLLFEKLNKGSIIYRCVNYINPPVMDISSLASPPDTNAAPNRFSRQGKSRLYASFDENTPLIEAVNNGPDAKHCCGTFELTRDIQVLNLQHLPFPIFLNVEDYWGVHFLFSFSRAIVQYVPEDDKDLYTPTQIMTDYFESSLSKYGIMGIKYGSSKASGLCNIVLFLKQEQCPHYMRLLKCEIK